jgi:hypothetical protein
MTFRFFWIVATALGFASHASLGNSSPASRGPLIDNRISVSHVSGLYPDWGSEYLIKGADTALGLGFQGIEIYMNPQICWTPHNHDPKDPSGGSRVKLGIYQTRDWCFDKQRELNMTQLDPSINNLTDLARHPRYQAVFNRPFRNYLLTVDPVGFGRTEYSACTPRKGAWDISRLEWHAASNWNIPGPTFTGEQLGNTYQEFYDLTRYLIDKYRGTNKTFILQTVNEMDWTLLPADNRGYPDPKKNPLLDRVKNAVSYWNTIQSAIDAARRDSAPFAGVGVYQGCEINHILKVLKKQGKAAVSELVPQTNCDLYGYSAYDTGFGDAATFIGALDYIEQQARITGARSVEPFSRKRVYISELGYKERSNKVFRLQNMLRNIQKALSWGVPIVNLWTLFDNECDQINPKLSQCRSGYWMIKPNETRNAELGIRSEQYNKILKKFQNK